MRESWKHGLCLLAAACSLVSCKESKSRSDDWIQPEVYALPANDIPADTRARLHPWVAGFIGLTPEQATERLRKRWAPIDRDSLKMLRETLESFEVRAVVDYKAGGLIYAVRPGADEGDVGNSFYLPAPLDRNEISKLLAPAKLQGNQALSEFLYYFGGLAEDIAISGDFVYSQRPWPLAKDSLDSTVKGYEEWKDSLMLYAARNGTSLLVGPDGKVAWWVLPEGTVDAESGSVDEWVVKFSEHRKHAYPYDAYGIPATETKEQKGPVEGEVLSSVMLTTDSTFSPATPLNISSLAPPGAGTDPRLEIQRLSGFALPSHWKYEATDNWIGGIFLVQITAPPRELREFCRTNALEEKPARSSDPWLQAKEDEKISQKAGPDGIEWRVNADAGKAIFIRLGPGASND